MFNAPFAAPCRHAPRLSRRPRCGCQSLRRNHAGHVTLLDNVTLLDTLKRESLKAEPTREHPMATRYAGTASSQDFRSPRCGDLVDEFLPSARMALGHGVPAP